MIVLKQYKGAPFSHTDPVCSIHVCPICGGRWSFNYNKYFDKPSNNIYYQCDDCGWEGNYLLTEEEFKNTKRIRLIDKMLL
jgi:hypothetical protein